MTKRNIDDIDKELEELLSFTENGGGFGAPDAKEAYDRKIQVLLTLREQEILKESFKPSALTQFAPRKFQEMAIDVMRQSVNEPRTDNKNSPLVGSVLYKPDGNIETAYRGELRHGDHAEFTLLERKLHNKRLDDSKLFATLEPCAPGARKHPKLSCSERIVLARIQEVWVGLEDPDPSVDRQGIKYLQDNGIIVHMFDRDLQDQIRQANKHFLEQAQERALQATQGKLLQLPELLKLDTIPMGLTLEDLSGEALEQYGIRTNLKGAVGSVSFYRRLTLQGILVHKGRKFIPTGLGLLLFGKEPSDFFPQAGLKATIEYPNGEHEIQDFNGPMILIPDCVEKWLKEKLPKVIDRNQMVREEKDALPFEAIREAIINALVHRDYEIVGATCHLIITQDTVIVKSPGIPPLPVTLEQLQNFTAPMLNRNPKLQFAFTGTKLVEGRGLGMWTLGTLAEKYHLPVPQYSFDGIYLQLMIYRHTKGAVDALEDHILNLLNRDEKKSWEYLATQKLVTRKQFVEQMGFDTRKAQRHLKRFVELGLLRKTGASSATKYEVRIP